MTLPGPFFVGSNERSRLCQVIAPALDESAFAPTSSYTLIKGATAEGAQALIDSLLSGSTILSGQIENTNGSNDALVKIQGSMDFTNWTDLLAYDQTGTVYGSVEITVTHSSRAFFFVTPLTKAGGVDAGWRFYRLVGKSSSATALRAYFYLK